MMVYGVALLCVFGLAAGQLLFKLGSAALAATGSLFNLKVATPIFGAMLIYGITSIAWVWVLQKVELGRIYPLMALAFVLVPIASHFVFGERFTPQYWVGLVMIVGGIVVAVRV